MPLSDENTGMMDGLGETSLEDLGLQTTLQEVLNLKTEHVIKLHLFLIQHSDPDETTQECVTWKREGRLISTRNNCFTFYDNVGDCQSIRNQHFFLLIRGCQIFSS